MSAHSKDEAERYCSDRPAWHLSGASVFVLVGVQVH